MIPILGFVLYLGATAIMKGFSAKEANRNQKEKIELETNLNVSSTDNSLSEELEKLNNLKESGVLTKEEFEKAKNKLLKS